MKRFTVVFLCALFLSCRAFAQDGSHEEAVAPKAPDEPSPPATSVDPAESVSDDSAPSTEPPAALGASSRDTDPCAEVSCAGHGKCVVKGGEPVCACDDGYIADPTTGLSCMRSPIGASVVPAKIQAALQLSQPQRAELVLRRDLAREFEEYRADPRDISFTEHMFRKYTHQRNAGIGVLVPGIVMMCSIGAFVAPAGSIEASRKNDQKKELEEAEPGLSELEIEERVNEEYQPSGAEIGLIAAGAAVGVIGMAAVIAGSVVVHKGRRGRRHLKPLRDAERLLEPSASFEVTPILFATASSAQGALHIAF